jgi:hypothetical protein
VLKGCLHRENVASSLGLVLRERKRKEVLLVCYWFALSVLISACLVFYRVCFGEASMCWCC